MQFGELTFPYCPFAQHLWSKVSGEIGLIWGYPDSCMDIFAANFSVVSGARGKVLWRAAVHIVSWSDFLERNKRILLILRSMPLNVGVAI